jgi:predicted nucleic acid-binding Zn ribbon protein
VTTTRGPDPDRADSPAAPALTHACVRCGAAIPLTDALCSTCNPAGLEQPAPSQAHGTVFLAIALAVVALGVALTVFVGGVGPFRANLRDTVPDGDGLVLTVAVENRGSRAGHASCRIWDPTYPGDPPVETYIRTPEVPAGYGLVFEQRVTALGSTVRPLTVDCSR